MEEKRGGAIPQKLSSHRCNMLYMLMYLGDYSMDVRSMPGNIVIRDYGIRNMDRFIQYNYSGKNVWQTNGPCGTSHLNASGQIGISMPLVVYSSADVPLYFVLRDVDISFAE